LQGAQRRSNLLLSVLARSAATWQSPSFRLCEEQRDEAISLFRLCEEQRDEAISFLKRETAKTLCQPDLPHPLKPNGKGSRSDGLKCPCEECCDKAICLFPSLRETQRRGNLHFPIFTRSKAMKQSLFSRLCEERSDVAICLFFRLCEEQRDEAIPFVLSLQGIQQRSNLQYHK